MKNTDKKASIKEMFAQMANAKTIPLCHRMHLVKLLHGRTDRFSTGEPIDKERGFFVVRLPFADYGDLVIDNECYAYLQMCKMTLESELNLPHAVIALTAEKKEIPNALYNHYCDYLAICAVNEFLFCGVDMDDYEDGSSDN